MAAWQDFFLSGWAAAPGITGTIATTQAAQSAALAASERFVGTASAAQARQTEAIAALLRFAATADVSQARQAATAAAVLRFAGAVVGSQARQTASVSAAERFAATVAAAQAAQVSAATGALAFRGDVASSQAPQVSAVEARLGFDATIAPAQAAQATASAGALRFLGTIDAAQAPQSAALTGTTAMWDGTITGTIATTQAAQIAQIDATVANPAAEEIVFFPWEVARPRSVPQATAERPIGRIAVAQARQSASAVAETVPVFRIVGAVSTMQSPQWGISFADVRNPAVGDIATAQRAQMAGLTARQRFDAAVAGGQARQAAAMSARMSTPKLEEAWLLGLIDDLDFLEAA